MKKGLHVFSKAASIGFFSVLLRLHRGAFSFPLFGDSGRSIAPFGDHKQNENLKFSPIIFSLANSRTTATKTPSPAIKMSALSESPSSTDKGHNESENHDSESSSAQLSKFMSEVISSCDVGNAKMSSVDTLNGALSVLQQFTQQSVEKDNVGRSPVEGNPVTEDTGDKDMNDLKTRLSSDAFDAADRLCRIAHAKDNTIEKKGQKNKKRTWEALKNAAGSLYNIPSSDKESTKSASSIIPSTPESNALAVGMVFGALSMIQQKECRDELEDSGSAKAAASALSSTISRNKVLQQNGQDVVSVLFRSFVDHAYCNEQELFRFDLNILTHLAKSFQLTDDLVEPRAIAHLLRKALPSLDTNYEREDLIKQTVSGALSLSCQVSPWSVLSPEELIDAATYYDFYHAALEVCTLAHKAAHDDGASDDNDTECDNKDDHGRFSMLEQQENSRCAVEKLIDTAMDCRMYRKADAMATTLYDMGGQSRYLEARYFHACETIAKVVAKRQFPIIDRQIERVDKAVAKVVVEDDGVDDTANTNNATSPSALPESPCLNIRKYAIEKLEEVGEITAAQRLASMYGIEYVYDEEAIARAAALRRETYLQYEDVLPGEVPLLTTEPPQLIKEFTRLLDTEPKLIGLDAEWDEETKGAALLQLSSTQTVLLVDVPSLSSTPEGVAALQQTVGALLDSPEWTVIGFACRQDLQRLRASKVKPENEAHWMQGTRAVVDVQPLVWEAEPSLRKTGLSRSCEQYFGKPLDKSEQCSLWSGRPLSDRQRSYAALDAWVCVGIYEKLMAATNGVKAE